MEKIKILDCRGKEYLEVERFGGDVKITIKDRKTNKEKFVFVCQMKEPSKRTYSQIEKLFKKLKSYLVERWEETQSLVWEEIEYKFQETL